MKDRKCFYVDVTQNIESDGRLLVIEENTSVIPFMIKRIFWVRDVKTGASRGNHATKKTKLVLIAVCGQCEVVVNDGEKDTVYTLNNPSKGLYIDEMLWRSMRNFTSDCVVEAICDNHYAGKDETYDDYEEYKSALKVWMNE